MTKRSNPIMRLRKGGSYSPKGGEVEVTGALAERMTQNGKRRLQLNRRERSALQRQARVEQAVALYLDLERPHSTADIARELGLSMPALTDLTKTKEFMEAYNLHFLELGHDPRIRAMQAAIADMLPKAVKTLGDLLEPNAPPTVRLQAAREILRQVGMDGIDAKPNERGEIAEFLKTAGVNIGSMNINLPAEYAQHISGEVVEAEFRSGSPQEPARSENSRLLPPCEDDIPS